MQRTWRRAWLRGKPHYMRHKPVCKANTGSIKANAHDLTVKAVKKLAPAAAAAGIFFSSLTGVQANPTGGSITAGTGSIIGQGTNHVAINQTSDKLAINWNNFTIGKGEKVQFIQPGASSLALNRVLGNNASAIYGQLSANGKVFLINPNGVLFAPGAQVNVGGLVASTLNLSDQDFMNGKYSFSGDSQQGVLNQGNITVANGGYAAFLGANAVNEGVILAKEGTVALGAGSKIALDFTGDGLLTLSVDESKVKAEVKNSGLIKADGGLVVMNAKAADSLTGSVVNNTGTIEAKSVTNKNGVIILTGDSVTTAGTLDASGKTAGENGGTVKVLGDTVRLAAGAAIDVAGDQGGGTALVGGAYQGGVSEYAATKTVVEQGTSINADAIHTGNGGQVVIWANDTTSFAGGISAKGGQNGGDGGSVETSGKKTLTVADTARVNTTAANGKTGNWLLDPADFIVDDTGNKGMTAATLSAALGSSSVTITTTADAASSTTGATNTDTSGSGDIIINSAVSWDADNNVLTLNAHRNININADVTASGAGAGLALSHGADGSYSLGSGPKITLSGENAKFSLNGSNYSVINRHSTDGALSALQNIKDDLSGNYFLGEDIDASDTANWNYWSYGSTSRYEGFAPIGAYKKEGAVVTINNPFTGSFDGGGHTISGLTINRPTTSSVGLFGYIGATSDIRNVGLVGGSVSGSSDVGSLVGRGSGSITNSYNSGSVSGFMINVGGLVGYIDAATGSITNSYNSGNVSGKEGTVGGLVGYSYGNITNSYNSGNVNSDKFTVGGLAGNSYHSNITNSYNTGSVSGKGSIGGLAGYGSGSITNSYNTGSVIGSSVVGGLVGVGFGSITDSYNSGSVSGSVNGNVSGSSKVGGLVGSNSGSSISNSYNDGIVTGDSMVGGLAGDGSGSITNSHNSGSVSGSTEVGGLAGKYSSSITNSYNSGNVIGSSNSSKVGGLVGSHTYSITNSYNSASVTGLTEVGGLVGYSNGSSSITNSYNSGSVIGSSGSSKIGGLVGYYESGYYIKNSYNSGSVTGDAKVGGLIGSMWSSVGIQDSFYATTDAAGGSINNGGEYDSDVWKGNGYGFGKTLAELQSASFWTAGEGAAWKADMDTVGGADKVWRIYDGHTTPLLKSFLTRTVVNADNQSKTYDGTVYSGSPTNVTYAPGTDFDLLLGTDKPSYGNARNAGTYGFLYSVQQGYDIVYGSGLLTIEKADLTVNLTGTVTKTYNGNNSAYLEGSNYSLSGLFGEDKVTVYGGTATYNDKNAGTGKQVTVSGLQLSGADAGNYNLTSSTATGNIGTITPKTLTPYLTGSVTKTYDGNNSAILAASNYYLLGLVSGDTLTVSGTATYNNKNAGTGKKVTASDLTLGGTGAANYSLASSTATANIGTINKAELTITAAANTKTYDGTTAAAATPTYSGLQEGDTLTNLIAVYEDKNAGSDKTLKVSNYTLNDGNNGNNYTVKLVENQYGTINKAELTITAAANTKTYDGTTAAAATPTYSGLQAGDSLTGLVEVYSDKNAGSGITLQVSDYTLTDGNNGGNYTVTLVDAVGSISQRQLTATATAANKVYDGNKSATVTGVTFGNLVEGESLTASYTGGTYETKDAGSGIKVTVNGVGMTAGADTLTANYLLPTEVTTTAAITPRQLTATATAQNKVYDGNKSATVTGVTFGNLVEGESLTASYTGGTYETKDAGSGIKVTVNGVGMTAGADTLTANYLLPTEVTTTAAITPRQLTATATAQNKVYDGTTNATITSVNFDNLVAGETLTAGYTGGAFSDQHVGDNKTITVFGLTMTAGADTLAGNYLLPASVTSNASITPASLTITANNAEKNYDRLAYEGGNGVTFDGFVGGETSDVLNGSLTYGGTAQGATEVGTYTITPAGLTAINYDITFRDGTLTIKPAAITDTHPGYVAAVQNSQQSSVHNMAEAGQDHGYQPANAVSPQPPAGGASPIQYSSETAATPRVITTAGETVTIAQDSLVQLADNPVQKEIAVYQTINGSSELAGVYQVDGSQSSLTVRKSDTPSMPASPAMPTPATAQTETASFQLTDRRGYTANFTIAYTGGILYIQGANATAADMLNQNQQLITATSLVAAQDKLGIDINALQAVHLLK